MQNHIPGEKNFLKEFRYGTEIWTAGVIDKHFGGIMYKIKAPKKTIKRHHNQREKRHSEDISNQKEVYSLPVWVSDNKGLMLLTQTANRISLHNQIFILNVCRLF